MCNCSKKCGCNITQITKGEKGDAGASFALPYKVYAVLLTQSGEDDPIATVLENTLGVSVNWYRVSQGNYYAEAIGAFTIDKTVIVPGVINFYALHNSVPATIDNVYIETIGVGLSPTPGPDDSLLYNTFIKIIVYN